MAKRNEDSVPYPPNGGVVFIRIGTITNQFPPSSPNMLPSKPMPSIFPKIVPYESLTSSSIVNIGVRVIYNEIVVN